MKKKLIFYDLMWYNYPQDKEYFFLNSDLLEWITHEPKVEKKLSSNTEEQEKIINKYSFLYKQIPFVENIYVCNSVSFKSVNENSDIDLFIVTKDNRIFLAKLFVWLFLKIFWMYGTHKKNKFCVWFYVTKSYTNLYPISISPIDLYLAYWIAHLQPIYSESWNLHIFKENLWVREIIPNYNFSYKKIINTQISYWKWFLKKFFEKIFGFNFLNNLLWFFWKKRMRKWKKQLWEKGKYIIISDNILKFQAPDIRKTVYLKYKILKDRHLDKKISEKSIF